MSADDVPAALAELLVAIDPARDRKLAAELLATAAGLAGDDADPLDLKIATAALTEMRTAFDTFAPYRHIPKVTVFGSARTRMDDPLYEQARAVAAALAAAGWMVVTGAGPGIMQAASEGAGREHTFGVNIRLPFEQGANPVIARDPKLVSMKYFFTRKLMLIKESKAFVSLPGGFGTLDETFELLTLTQTGKGMPVPIVLLDTPGDTYWAGALAFMRNELLVRGLIEQSDLDLVHVTSDVDDVVAHIARFYRNYDSIRFVGKELVLRMKRAPNDAQLAALNEKFGYLCATGAITRSVAMKAEIDDGDRLELARLRLTFGMRHYSGLRQLIDALNDVTR
jgi:uncharacterized protein (TIGR00730 family)